MRTALALLLALACPLTAATDPKSPARDLSKDLAGMTFRSLGPSRGGRVTAVAGVPGKPLLFYFGSTGGGVFRTTDGGASWDPMSDKDLRTGSVGSLAVSPSDPNVIYAGMGEGPIRGNVSHGDGVYRSTDAGKSWKSVGLAETRQIPSLVVHPTNPDLVYAAAQGHVWGPNAERGVFRSQDGGKSWKKVLYVDEKTGASDLVMDPTNPRILFAGFWQVVRKPWALESGGPGGGVFRSTDGGDTWKKLTEGLPEGVVGKVGVAVSPARPERVWAIVEAAKGGLFRSDDGGERWTRVNDENKLRQRAWYYSRIVADPKSDGTLYALNVRFLKSVDGGKTFEAIATRHGDHHALWIDPDEPQRMILGDDGGAAVSVNGGRTFSTLDNQPTGQFYRVATDDRVPYRIYGAQQDNSTVAIASSGRDGVVSPSDWYPVGGCESGWVAPNLRNPSIVYAGCYGGSITRYDHETGQAREIVAWPQLAIGQAPKDLRYRFQWNAPILVSRHDPRTIYHAAQLLLRSRDEGETWEEVSPDLTRSEKSTQESSGGPITKDNTGVEVYGTIFALAESATDPLVLWAGTDDGLVHVTRDGGRTWKDVTPKAAQGWPDRIQVNALELSPHDPDVVYVAATRYKHDDLRPYLFKTADGGKTWTRIGNGIPEGAFTRVVREDPVRRGLLFAGTETGLYVSLNDGVTFVPFQQNLPAVPITDLAVKSDDLVVATQGRAFFVLDDLSPLQQWKDEIERSEVALLRPRPAFRAQGGGPVPEPGRLLVGQNPPGGVLVSYWLKEKPKGGETVKLEVLDGDRVLRTFESKDKSKEKDEDKPKRDDEDDKEKPLEPKEGLNRFVWDLRMLKPSLLPKAIIWGSKEGPIVAPGTYTLRLTAKGKTLTETAEVRPHPALNVSPQALSRQAAFLATVRDRLTETHQTALSIRDVTAQLDKLAERAKKLGKGAALEERCAALKGKLGLVEEQLVNPKHKSEQDVLNFPPRLDHQLVGLVSVVASAEAAPAPSAVAYLAELEARLAALKKELAGLLSKDLDGIDRLAREQGIPAIVVVPPAS